MSDEEKQIEEQEDSFYDDIRADVETAVYAFATLEELDTALYSKIMQNNIRNAKKDCVAIICKGIKALREGYEEKGDEDE